MKPVQADIRLNLEIFPFRWFTRTFRIYCSRTHSLSTCYDPVDFTTPLDFSHPPCHQRSRIFSVDKQREDEDETGRARGKRTSELLDIRSVLIDTPQFRGGRANTRLVIPGIRAYLAVTEHSWERNTSTKGGSAIIETAGQSRPRIALAIPLRDISELSLCNYDATISMFAGMLRSGWRVRRTVDFNFLQRLTSQFYNRTPVFTLRNFAYGD